MESPLGDSISGLLPPTSKMIDTGRSCPGQWESIEKRPWQPCIDMLHVLKLWSHPFPVRWHFCRMIPTGSEVSAVEEVVTGGVGPFHPCYNPWAVANRLRKHALFRHWHPHDRNSKIGKRCFIPAHHTSSLKVWWSDPQRYLRFIVRITKEPL